MINQKSLEKEISQKSSKELHKSWLQVLGIPMGTDSSVCMGIGPGGWLSIFRGGKKNDTWKHGNPKKLK